MPDPHWEPFGNGWIPVWSVSHPDGVLPPGVSGITEITSTDASLTVTNPEGPTTNVEVT